MKFQIDHDLHIHSKLSSCSNHPEQTTENILKYAAQNGLKHICLTDHFWDSDVPGASFWYKPQNYEHLSNALPLPKADGIRFDFGCEGDMDMHFTLGISPDKLDKFDFIVVPTSHLHMETFTIEKGDIDPKRRAELYMKRNHALLDMDLPFHKMGLAHFTCRLACYNTPASVEEFFNLISDAEYAELFERVAKSGMGVELNMWDVEYDSPRAFSIYRIARECGCKFYLGSDAHTPSQLASAMSRFNTMVDALDLTEDDKHPYIAR